MGRHVQDVVNRQRRARLASIVLRGVRRLALIRLLLLLSIAPGSNHSSAWPSSKKGVSITAFLLEPTVRCRGQEPNALAEGDLHKSSHRAARRSSTRQKA